MGAKQIEKLVAALASQDGMRARRTGKSNGWRIYLPDGSQTTIHGTLSDRRAMRNIRATIERSGAVWPEKEGKP
jgi:hypothetical protein